MNPRTIRWQAAVNLALLLLVAFLVAPLTALCIALPVLAWGLFLNGSYARSLGARGRSERRMHGDRWIVRFISIGLLVPILVAILLLGLGYNADLEILSFTVAEGAAMLVALSVLFAAVIASSLVDWYYIRPRIDAVVCTAPCRSSGSETWKNPTRWWMLHRGLATAAYFLFAVVLALVVLLMLARENPVAASVIGGVGSIASLFLILAGIGRDELETVARFVQSPDYCLGDDLTYQAYKWGGRGFVLHVAFRQTKLVPLDEHGERTEIPWVHRDNVDLVKADLESRTTKACSATCVKLNPECGEDAERHDQRRRLLVF